MEGTQTGSPVKSGKGPQKGGGWEDFHYQIRRKFNDNIQRG